MKRKFLFLAIFLITFFFVASGRAEASEGIVELENLRDSTSRCFAMSTSLNRSNNFQLLIQCRDLIYPIEPSGQFYVLWANTIGEKPATIRVGELAYGKISYTVRSAFSELFVTQEQLQTPKQPSGSKIMEGSVKPIEFLMSNISPTNKPTPTLNPKTTPKVTPAAKSSGGSSVSTILLAVFIFIAIAVIVVIIIFVVNKLRSVAA